MNEDIRSLLTEAVNELKDWVTKQLDERFEQPDKKIEARFEQQDKKIEARFEQQEMNLSQMFDNRFEKQEIMLEQRISQLKDEFNEEAKEHMEALVEQVGDTAGGAYRDELGFVKDKVEGHEERITNLEEKVRP